MKLARMYVASARGSCSRVSDTSEGREGGREGGRRKDGGGREGGGKTGEGGRQQGGKRKVLEEVSEGDST